ncbi:EH signature domain-containing protein [Moraxella oblonga]|uniref:EH signature domain-containing protein n=1 Tax=Moraxella oblonga TaxID=200413 RepID=UPI000836614A|nr:EH signature domain-containing protein [Moraxella oblonga]
MLNHQYPSRHFLTALENASEKLKQIGQGKESGKDYERLKRMLLAYVYSQNNEIIFYNQNDIRRVLSVLTQEVSYDNDVLRLLIEKSKFNHLFKAISEQLNDDYKNLIAKKLLYLYYSRYYSIESLSQKERVYFYTLLNKLIKEYDGKNMLLTKAKQNTEIIIGDLYHIIYKYKDLDNIYKQMGFLKKFEIWQRIQIIFLLEKVKSWQANQYNDDIHHTLEEILIHKNVMVGGRTLLEETAYLVLKKCKEVNIIGDKWTQFITENIGDPRIMRHQNRWFRIGEEYYHWLRTRLSIIIVEKFLTSMTDGQGDAIYQYRRQFWLQYTKHIQYAKVMINSSGIGFIKMNNSEIAKEFDLSPEIYSKLNDAHRSCIFMDFGHFCVIEGTHSAKLRFYSKNPIDLSKKTYNYDEFYRGSVNKLLIQDYNHINSSDYYWQNLVRGYIADNFGIKVKLEDIILKEDKHRLQKIKEHLHNANQSII